MDESLVERALAYVKGELLFTKTNLQHAIDVAEQKAQAINVPVTICISDQAGNPRILYRMEKANLVSLTLAPKKANSALLMRKPTKDLNQDTVPGGELYQMETMLDGQLVTFAGGIPLVIDDVIIGAIGVSGGLVSEDQLICETAVNAFLAGC